MNKEDFVEILNSVADSLRSEMGSMRNEMSSMRSEMGSMRSDMSSMRSEITKRIDDLSDQMETLATMTARRFDEQAAQITELQEKTGLSAIHLTDQKIYKLTEEVEENSSQITMIKTVISNSIEPRLQALEA